MYVKLSRTNIEEFLDYLEREIEVTEKYILLQEEQKKNLDKNITILEELENCLECSKRLYSSLEEVKECLLEVQIKKAKNQDFYELLVEANKMYDIYLDEKLNVFEKFFELQNILSNEYRELLKEKEIKETENIENKDKIEELEITETAEQIESDPLKKKTVKKTSEVIEENIVEENIEKQDNPNLIISEKQNRIYLPYKYKELEKILKEDRTYTTVEEIIQNEYILPMEEFKNTVKARFKEAYNLIKKKEKRNSIDALSLGMELMFNYKLHPAIIAACKTEDELDIYLDCLDENDLQSFEIFNVIYDIAPAISIKADTTKRRRNVEI